MQMRIRDFSISSDADEDGVKLRAMESPGKSRSSPSEPARTNSIVNSNPRFLAKSRRFSVDNLVAEYSSQTMAVMRMEGGYFFFSHVFFSQPCYRFLFFNLTPSPSFFCRLHLACSSPFRSLPFFSFRSISFLPSFVPYLLVPLSLSLSLSLQFSIFPSVFVAIALSLSLPPYLAISVNLSLPSL